MYNIVCLNHFGSKIIVHFLNKSVLLVGVFSKSGLFSEITLIVHNLCFERPISKLKYAFSSFLIVLQYGVLSVVLTLHT